MSYVRSSFSQRVLSRSYESCEELILTAGAQHDEDLSSCSYDHELSTTAIVPESCNRLL